MMYDLEERERLQQDAWGRGNRQGRAEGYRQGEMERIALATANSELRSEILALQQERSVMLRTWDAMISEEVLLRAELKDASDELARHKWEHGYPPAG